MYTLYLKTHKKTGLKYLGYTHLADPYRYKGSGVYWKKHISKHGYDVHTEILRLCATPEELSEWGLHFSDLWDVSNSPEFANLKEERGIGGKYSDDVRAKMSTSAKLRVERLGPPGCAFTSEQVSARNKETWQDPTIRAKRIEGMSKALRGVPRRPHSEESKQRRKLSGNRPPLNKGKRYTMKTVVCPHCNKVGSGGNMSRYHFNNCKTLTGG